MGRVPTQSVLTHDVFVFHGSTCTNHCLSSDKYMQGDIYEFVPEQQLAPLCAKNRVEREGGFSLSSGRITDIYQNPEITFFISGKYLHYFCFIFTGFPFFLFASLISSPFLFFFFFVDLYLTHFSLPQLTYPEQPTFRLEAWNRSYVPQQYPTKPTVRNPSLSILLQCLT